MKHHALLLMAGLLVAACWAPAGAQTEDSAITIYGGLTVFNNPSFDSVALVEFPFVLNRNQFDFFRQDSTSQLEARIFAQVTVLNLQGTAIDSATTYFSARVASPEEARIKGIRLFNSLALPLKPGLYSARLSAIDVVSKHEGSIFYSRIEVPPVDSVRLTIGAANLAYSITPVSNQQDASDKAIRNGFRVLVNPINTFGTDDSTLYFYGEIYNLAYDAKAPSQFRFDSYVVDDKNQICQDFGYALRPKPGTSAVITQSYDIKHWRPGKYGLDVIITDLSTNQVDTSFLPFRIINPAVQNVADIAPGEVVDPYDSLAYQEKVNLAYYLLTPVEKQTLQSLAPIGKENFLRQYWREHDSDPSTKLVENRVDMIHRYEFANQTFSTDDGKTNGWFTDRGRIYMIYGPWDERDDIPAPVKGNAFEVWYYRQTEKQLLFVFEDKEGNHDSKLVHSNAKGERFDQSWQNVIDAGQYDIK